MAFLAASASALAVAQGSRSLPAARLVAPPKPLLCRGGRQSRQVALLCLVNVDDGRSTAPLCSGWEWAEGAAWVTSLNPRDDPREEAASGPGRPSCLPAVTQLRRIGDNIQIYKPAAEENQDRITSLSCLHQDLKGSEMYQVGIEQHLVEKGEKCYKVSQGYLEKEVLKAGREARKDPTLTPPQDLLEDLPSDRAEEEAPSRAKENPKPEKSMEVAISACEHNSRDKSMAVINTYSWWMA
ncbi:hypothetical protein R6Z07M_015230 [Ovis aries]